MQSSFENINGSYKFKNVLIKNGKLFYVGDDFNNIPLIRKFPVGSCFLEKKQLTTFPDLSKTQTIGSVCLGDNLWYGNIGHALFDGLYPIYLAMIKFQDQDKDFTYTSHSWTNRQTLSTEAVNVFSGSELINFDSINDYVFCKNLFTGCGNKQFIAGNCVINKKYQVYGQSEYNAFSLFKRRMLEKFGATPDKPVNKNLKIIIVDNKRFSKSERDILHKLAKNYGAEYIHWSQDLRSFSEQMNFIQDVDIQITGPGTGMMYTPFLKQGAVNINLGYIDRTQTNTARPNIYIKNSKQKDHLVPGWMEQSICAASDYVNTIYYDRYNYNNLEYEGLEKLLQKAKSSINIKSSNNWNTDAIIFKEYCKLCKNANKITSHLSNVSLFIEFFINEHPLAICDGVDIDLLRSLKKKFGYESKYLIGKET